ncbi:MAG TPA: MerR family transcriptional regulator [Streptosporangiaceae bacterium]|jgi:DNA-binding transcriptional MerR regulator
MQVRLPIGDFAKMTHLSVKALRHYHDVGVLEPAQVDPWSGYRFYEPDQIPVAQVIRRFRELGMPLEEVKAVLQAPDVGSRNDVIVAHLERMESQLAQTQAVVASLRSLLERPAPAVSVEYRSVGRARALAVRDVVTEAEVQDWWVAAFSELHAALAAAGIAPAGAGGALYAGELFEVEKGEVVAFVPVPAGAAGGLAGGGRAAVIDVPAAELAVALHQGPFPDLDRTYGALGTYVAERELGVDGPIREYYLVAPWDTGDESAHRTEVGWPIFQTTGPGRAGAWRAGRAPHPERG